MFFRYKVTTSTNKSAFEKGDIIVNRRYSEFAWLSKELSRVLPGCIIPALPEKQVVGRFSSDFVEQRQRALERFLQRCAVHNELGQAKCFVNFLQSDDTSFMRLMEETKASKPGITSSAMSWFDNTVNRVQNSGKVSKVK